MKSLLHGLGAEKKTDETIKPTIPKNTNDHEQNRIENVCNVIAVGPDRML